VDGLVSLLLLVGRWRGFNGGGMVGDRRLGIQRGSSQSWCEKEKEKNDFAHCQYPES
jgi:hypothetical protein